MSIQLVDTHCHIHEAAGTDEVAAKWHKAGKTDPAEMLGTARDAGVVRLICVGCTLEDSQLAIDFAKDHSEVSVSIGIHPHEAQKYDDAKLAEFAALLDLPDNKIVAIGECGLDYYYNHSPKEAQIKVLRFQLELAAKHNLPLIFHVRDAFEDFWPIFDEYKALRGVIHSFSSDIADLSQVLRRGLYVGQNGIMTFTKHVKQLDAAKAIPLSSLLLETDAPFLTPQPFRGSICEPRHVRVTAEFLAELRGETLESLAQATTTNAHRLFGKV